MPQTKIISSNSLLAYIDFYVYVSMFLYNLIFFYILMFLSAEWTA